MTRTTVPERPLCIDCKTNPAKSPTAKRCLRCQRDKGRRASLNYYYRVRRVNEGRNEGSPVHDCKPMADGTCVKCGRTIGSP